MAAGHFVQQCKHGVVGAQCRCPGPKDVQVVECGKVREHDHDAPVYEPKHSK